MVVRHRKPTSPNAPLIDPEDEPSPRITSKDRLIFNCFRAVVGVGVLGLIVAMYAAALPLLLGERLSSPAMPTDDANGTASTDGWKLWTAQDSEAVRGMAVISSVQACLLAVGFFCFRRQRALGAEAASAKAAALRRDATRRMRQREKKRVQQDVQQQVEHELREQLHKAKGKARAMALAAGGLSSRGKSSIKTSF